MSCGHFAALSVLDINHVRRSREQFGRVDRRVCFRRRSGQHSGPWKSLTTEWQSRSRAWLRGTKEMTRPRRVLRGQCKSCGNLPPTPHTKARRMMRLIGVRCAKSLIDGRLQLDRHRAVVLSDQAAYAELDRLKKGRGVVSGWVCGLAARHNASPRACPVLAIASSISLTIRSISGCLEQRHREPRGLPPSRMLSDPHSVHASFHLSPATSLFFDALKQPTRCVELGRRLAETP
jgi:hypothetical protein